MRRARIAESKGAAAEQDGSGEPPEETRLFAARAAWQRSGGDSQWKADGGASAGALDRRLRRFREIAGASSALRSSAHQNLRWDAPGDFVVATKG